jgi:alkylhydroperoxidase family enzyme
LIERQIHRRTRHAAGTNRKTQGPHDAHRVLGVEAPAGKVMTPMKVISTRMPKSLKLSYEMQKFEMNGIKLDPALKLLVVSLAAQINGCGFCIDIGRAVAIRQHVGMDKFDILMDYKTNPLFSDRERAALAYVEEATRNKHVSDETFEKLSMYFNDREIVEITWLNALENYYNLLNIPLEIESDGLCAIAQHKVGQPH